MFDKEEIKKGVCFGAVFGLGFFIVYAVSSIVAVVATWDWAYLNPALWVGWVRGLLFLVSCGLGLQFVSEVDENW